MTNEIYPGDYLLNEPEEWQPVIDDDKNEIEGE